MPVVRIDRAQPVDGEVLAHVTGAGAGELRYNLEQCRECGLHQFELQDATGSQISAIAGELHLPADQVGRHGFTEASLTNIATCCNDS